MRRRARSGFTKSNSTATACRCIARRTGKVFTRNGLDWTDEFAHSARYWQKVGKRALKYLGHRPLKLVRHSRGTTFYHKGPLPREMPASVHRLPIKKREGGKVLAGLAR
jgi:hypothetical protein